MQLADFRQIACYLHSLGLQYADGLERVELMVCSGFSQLVPDPTPGQRFPIRLKTPPADYEDGLRKYDNQVYVCPDLPSNGRKVSTDFARQRYSSRTEGSPSSGSNLGFVVLIGCPEYVTAMFCSSSTANSLVI